MLFNCYHTVLIDYESHPGFKTEEEAIAIAHSLTTNETSDFEYDGNEEDGRWELLFQENVVVESPDEESLEFQKITPQCPGAEFNSAYPRRARQLRKTK